MFTGLGKLSSRFNPDLKISPEFLRGFSFHLQPKFPRGFPPPTTKIPGDSPQNPRDFARWELSSKLPIGFGYVEPHSNIMLAVEVAVSKKIDILKSHQVRKLLDFLSSCKYRIKYE